MKDKKVSAFVGTVVLVIIAITVSAFVWVYEKDKIKVEQSKDAYGLNTPQSLPSTNESNQQQSEKNQAHSKDCSGHEDEKRICKDGDTIARFDSNCRPSTCMEIVAGKQNIYGSHFIKKDADIFYEEPRSNSGLSPIIGADASTFRPIDLCASVEMSAAFYGKDKNSVYVNNTRIESIDAESFEYLGLFGTGDGIVPRSISIARDKNHIYYACGKAIDSIDRQSFEVLSDGYAKDNNHVYYLDTILNKADHKSFQSIGRKKLDGIIGSFALDNNFVYFEGMIIKNADSRKCRQIGIEKCLSENWHNELDNSESSLTNLLTDLW